MTSSLTHSAPTTEKKTWKLKDISLKIGSGATPRGGEAAYLKQKVNYAFVRSQNVFDFKFNSSEVRFISDEAAQKLKGVHLQKDDILLNITGDGRTFARCCIVDEEVLPAAVNQHVAIIRLDQQVCLPGYLLAYLCLPETKAYIASFNAGGSRRAITKGHIESFEIPAVPIEKQKVIQDVLFSLISKIDLNQTLNQTLEEIAQAIFKSWFVDFEPVKAKMRGEQPEGMDADTAALFPDKLVESELGLIPEGWEVKPFKRVIDKYIDNRGKTPPLSNEGIPLIEVKHIPANSNFPIFNTDKKFTEETYNTWFRAHVEPKDILISTVGTIGRTSIVKDTRFGIAQNVLGLRFGEVTTPEYMFFTIKAHRFQHDMDARLVTTVQSSIKRKDLNTIDILTPPVAIQQKFSELAAGFLDTQFSKAQENIALEKLRDTLLPKLLSGEIDLDLTNAELIDES
jgi:type I restriction enzyme S subunit